VDIIKYKAPKAVAHAPRAPQLLVLGYLLRPPTYLWNLSKKFSQKIVRLPHQKRIALFFTGLCIFTLAVPQLAPASAQTTQATVQEILDGNQVFIQNKQASLNDKPILKIEPDAKPTKQPDEVVLKAGKKVEVAQTGGLGIIQFPVGFVSGSVTNLDRLSSALRYR